MTEPRAGAGDAPDVVDKKALRKRLLAERRAMPDRDERAARLADNLVHWLEQHPFATVGAYWPIRGEFDPLPALARWQAAAPAGTTREIGLPVIETATSHLRFHGWWPGAPMLPDQYGIPTPDGTPRVEPDVLLVPCVGFAPGGFRLGYGGGYYDRTLGAAGPHPATLGIAYAAGFVPELPVEVHDIALDGVLTEDGEADVRIGGDSGPATS